MEEKSFTEALWDFIDLFFPNTAFDTRKIRIAALKADLTFPSNFVPSMMNTWRKKGFIVRVGEKKKGGTFHTYKKVAGAAPYFKKPGEVKPTTAKKKKVKTHDGLLDAAEVGKSIIAYINHLTKGREEGDKEMIEENDRLQRQINSLQTKIADEHDKKIQVEKLHEKTIHLLKERNKKIMNEKGSSETLDLDQLKI